MDPFTMFLLAATASWAVGQSMIKVPDDVAPDESDPYSAPQSTPGNPIPLVFGTRRVKGVNVLWYGNTKSVAIKKKVKKWFKTKKYTIGYKYYIQWCIGVAYSFPNMRIRNIYFGEDPMVSNAGILGSTSWGMLSGDTMTVDKPDLYGGTKSGGGLVGAITFWDGVNNPHVGYVEGTAPQLLTVMNNTEVKYNKVARLVFTSKNPTFGSFYIGTSKQVRSVSVILANTGFADNLTHAPITDGVDVNPAWVVQELLLSSDLGGLSGDEVNTQSLTDAQQILWDEGILISPMFAREKSLKNMIKPLLNIMGGLMFVDPLDGRLNLKLVRQEDITGNEVLVTEDNLHRVISAKTPSRADLPNEVKLTYTARTHGYSAKTISAQDIGGYIERGGRFVTKQLNYPSICSDAVANIVVNRELSLAASPLTTLKLETNRILASTRVADIVHVQLPSHGITDGYFRVVDIDYQDVRNNRITVTLLEVGYANVTTAYNSTEGSAWQDPSTYQTLAEVTDAIYKELPIHLVYRLSDTEGLPLTDQFNHFVIVTAAHDLSGFDTYLSPNQGTAYSLAYNDAGITPTSTLANGVPKETDTEDNTHAFTITYPDAELDPDVTLTSTENATTLERYALVGAEWIGFTGITDLGGGVYGLDNVQRGIFDTVPIEHFSGEPVYFLSEYEPILSESGIPETDSPLHVKLDPYNAASALGLDNVSHVDSVQESDRIKRPIAPGRFLLSGKYYPSAADPIYGQLTVAWNHRRRDYFDTAVLQSSSLALPIDDNVEYTLRIYEADKVTLIHQVPNFTGSSYIYTKEQELLDHGTNDSQLWIVLVTTDTSLNLESLFRREQMAYFAGYGYNYGADYGR